MSMLQTEAGGNLIEEMLWGIDKACIADAALAHQQSCRFDWPWRQAPGWPLAHCGPRKTHRLLVGNPAVALVENLVNLRGNPRFFRPHFQLLKVGCGDNIHAMELSSSDLSAIDEGDFKSTQAIGDAWLAARSSALLRVPSIPSPESWNYLLNPLHPDASLLKIEWARHIMYDKRLFRLTDS